MGELKLNTPVLCDLFLQELHAPRKLLHAIDAVFDADPAVEAFALQLGEDGVIVVEALADLAVAEALGVALGTAFSLRRSSMVPSAR